MLLLEFQKMLTKRNLQYLSVLLRVILGASNDTTLGTLFWAAFLQKLPNVDTAEVRERLAKLADLLEQYRKQK